MRSPLLSPVWLVAHVLVAVVLATFPLLGLWQLDRHEQQQATNTALEQRPDQPPLTAEQLGGDADRLAYRRITLTGEWEPGKEVLLSTRPHQGRPGHHVLTPLRLDGGSAVLVDRGWVPYDVSAPPLEEAPPPDGRVEVRGTALPRQPARRAGALDGEGRAAGEVADGESIEFVSHPDPVVVGRTLDEPLPPVVVRAHEGHRPADAELPVTVPPPEPERDVNHFSYAMQWFLFTAVVAIGYPVLLLRRRRDSGHPPPDAGPPTAESDSPPHPDPDRSTRPGADLSHPPDPVTRR